MVVLGIELKKRLMEDRGTIVASLSNVGDVSRRWNTLFDTTINAGLHVYTDIGAVFW